MTTYIVDASVVVKWFFPEQFSDECRQLIVPGNDLLAPDLIWSEAGNVVWKRFVRQEITAAETVEVVSDIVQMPVIEIPTHSLLPGAVEISVAVGITVYDALYLAVALSRACILITADQKLINKLTDTTFASNVRHVSQLGNS